MNHRVILCEGESDSILISYYLIKKKNWSSVKQTDIDSKILKNLVRLRNGNPSETGDWYVNPARSAFLYIWAIGGKEFNVSLGIVLDYNRKSQENLFTEIAIITDHDDKNSEEEIIESVRIACLANNIDLTAPFSCNTWLESNEVTYPLNPQKQIISFFASVMPEKEEGTLETFLLNCLSSQDKRDKKVIDQCISFINEIDCSYIDEHGTKCIRYLHHRGDRPKAKFSVFFSVVNPRKVFCTGNAMLLSVPWESYDTFNEYFGVLAQKF